LLTGLVLARGADAADAVGMAVAYLARETPRWEPQNHCFSCHNNGDGARALMLAKARGYEVPASTLAGTLEWLRRPEAWDESRGNPGFSDRKLARIQFSAALVEAVRDGFLPGRGSLERAADALAGLQDSSGAWTVDTGGVTGAPATYGPVLATFMARRALQTAAAPRFDAAIARAGKWLLAAAPGNVLDRAAILLALPDTAAKHLRALLAAQNSDGGWGPQPRAPSEAFDTAVALLSLHGVGGAETTKEIGRGRVFLEKFQLNDGSWPETTRPSGFTSYAERISTAGWAAYALLALDTERH
jgi:hypothetical protein